MLILTRRVGETLVIDDGENEVTVTVIGVKGNQVRLGINAPRHIAVDREEIHQRKKAGAPRPSAMVDRRPIQMHRDWGNY